MKFLFRIAVTLGMFSAVLGECRAQENQGALAFVNAVGLDTPTEILANGTSIKPGGFLSGQVTSFIAVPANALDVRAKNGDLKAKSLSVTPSPAGSTILVVSLFTPPGAEAEKERELQVISIPSDRAGGGFNQRVLFVGQQNPLVVLANGERITLTPGVPSSALQSGAVKIETEGGEFIGESSSPEPGNFLIVVFPNSRGGYGATSIRDNLITFKAE